MSQINVIIYKRMRLTSEVTDNLGHETHAMPIV